MLGSFANAASGIFSRQFSGSANVGRLLKVFHIALMPHQSVQAEQATVLEAHALT